MTSSEVVPSRAFRRYWRADAVSGFGTYVTVFALQALVVLTLVDGKRRLPLMVTTDLLQAVLLLSIPLLWWLGLLSLPAVLLIVLLTPYRRAAIGLSSLDQRCCRFVGEAGAERQFPNAPIGARI